MTIGNSRSRSECLGRDKLPHQRSMSPTSHLAHHPLGAAVARSPHQASDGGGEGWPIPLVSQSEQGRDGLPVSFEPIRIRSVQTLEPAWQASGRVCMRRVEGRIARPGWRTRATPRASICWD